MSRTDQEKAFLEKQRLTSLYAAIDMVEQLNEGAKKVDPKTDQSFLNELGFLQILIVFKDWARELELKEKAES
jgi:hypothetical protein